MRKLIILFLILPLGGPCIGQSLKIIKATTEDGKKVVLKSDKTWEYETETPLKNNINDPQTATVKKTFPIQFSGDNLVFPELISFINSLKDKIAKSEFETEGQYRTRVKQFAAETKFRDKYLNEFVFVDSSDFSYFAESQTFFSSIFMVNSNGYTLKLVERKQPIYDTPYYEYDMHFAYLSLKMSPDLAKEKKLNLRVAIYGYPAYTDNKALCWFPTRYVIFDYLTGEIYGETLEYAQEVK